MRETDRDERVMFAWIVTVLVSAMIVVILVIVMAALVLHWAGVGS